jgi:myo-inositol-1(or 4)-monophosphatase
MRELVRNLALALRERVLPHLGSHAARAHEAEAASGDVTFTIDAEAERELEAFLVERAPDVAFDSEDRGLVEPAGGGAGTVLVVDPIDGTRPALAGLESCCVSVAAAPLDGEPTMAEVSIATGQLDAVIEPGPRLIDEVPGMLAEFERVGGGSVLNNSPYDIAAAT